MACINKNHPEITKMAEELNVSPAVLSAKIGIWQTKNNIIDKFPTKEELNIQDNSIIGKLQLNLKENEVNQTLKAVDILSSDKAKQVFEKGKKSNWDLNKILTELQIPKDQKQLILDKDIKDREEIITSLLADNSYIVEINTAKTKGSENYSNGYYVSEKNDKYYVVNQGNNFNEKFDTWEEANELAKEKNSSINNTQYYSNLTVPGGTNYTENEIATPAITPSIKGHAEFATDNGIGWFRGDDQIINLNNLEDLGIIKKVSC